VNHRIRFPQVRVIDPEGNQLGVMSPDDARGHAKEFGLDLVEVAPKARPPVCRIMDYGKYKYEQSKKSSGSARTSSKTYRMRPNISDHDLDTKLRKALSALEKGDQVKLVMRMRGRERAYPDRWVEMMKEIISTMEDRLDRDMTVVQRPKAEGRQITTLLEPA